MAYDHKTIEKKWQKFWKKNETFKADLNKDQKKYYALDMFPYPSGQGLHVGHPEGYTATDVMSRMKRMQGFNVLHPMGWDAFGLPAEQYALKTGHNPKDFTNKNIDHFRDQIQSLGFSYDWDREVNTTDPKFYKWTQWIFEQLYKKGLAYESEIMVNWAPDFMGGTVVANEEVEDGKTKRGGYPVYRKPMRQWVLKITAYADRLIDDLDLVDWPESVKEMQRNWIGRSEGASVFFPVVGDEDTKIEVFTTRADTLFGASYVVLAPEQELVDQLTTPEHKAEVEKYKEEASRRSDLERTDLNKDKTGVFTGSYVINPVNGEKLPIWISDYVLASYGTGAVMAVPSGDQRDYDFATKFDLPIAVLHLLYARFWHKVLYDLGLVPTKEPFMKLVNQGMILGSNHEKMSKSKGNVVNPDDIVDQYGADTLRLYEMFMGPLEESVPWDEKGLHGANKWVQRVWRLLMDDNNHLRDRVSTFNDGKLTKVYNQTVKKVTEDYERMHFNTAISQLMVFVNEAYKVDDLPVEYMKGFVKMIAPIMPHMAEELWSQFGESDTITYQPWPTYDPKALVEDEVEMIVQVNGKVRAKIKMAKDTDRDEAQQLALANEHVKKFTDGKDIKKVIVVPNKIVNIVAKQ